MKIRAVAASALALTLAVGLAGCNLISPQRTTTRYDASDGVGVTLGDIRVENAMLITDGTGSQANLVLAGVNTTDHPAELQVVVAGQTILVPLGSGADSLTQVGYGNGGQQLIDGDFDGGSNVEVAYKVTYTDSEGNSKTVEDEALVPVLGDADPNSVLEEYRTLMPTPEATSDAVQPAETTAQTEEPAL